MNLVINASEALGERPGEITLHTGVLDADAAYFASAQVAENLPAGRYVFLEVVDTGTGMDRETLARIFDPFFTTKFTGRGLGLAAVQGIIRGHRGAVRVYSEPGRGTTFKILFPAAEGAAEPSRVDSAHPLPEKGEGHILIIDDESTVRETSTAILRAYGFTAESAVDGRHGLEIFKASQTPISAVLLDLTMPNMDGEETFRQLRQLNPGVKVVLMSGFNKVDAINRFTGKGLAGFVQKPFDFETLLRELRRVLET
jgi:CheY-like chemotaxis protein